MNALVTGGAGFVGSALCNRLADDGHLVTALDDFSRGRKERLSARVGAWNADIRDANAVDLAVERADVIFHLAYLQGTQNFYSNPKQVIDVALTGMMNVLHACEYRGDKELILVSSSEAYQIPPEGMTPTDETVPLSVPDVTNARFSYGGGKIACEIATLAYAEALKRAVIVRPHNVYGKDMGHEHVIPQFCERMNHLPVDTEEVCCLGLSDEECAFVPTRHCSGLAPRPGFTIMGTGEETRSFCHIDDAVEALLVLLEHGENAEVYHLGTMEEVTVADLAHRIAACYGREITVVPSELAKGSPPRRLPDIAKLSALGYKPSVTLDEGLPGTVEWYKVNAK